VNYFNQKTLKYAELAPKRECTGMAELEVFLQDIVDAGGEGIILRDPAAPYQPGRSPGYLKHKVSGGVTPCSLFYYSFICLSFSHTKKFRDSEAKVVASAGVHQWECELYVISKPRNYSNLNQQAQRGSISCSCGDCGVYKKVESPTW